MIWLQQITNQLEFNLEQDFGKLKIKQQKKKMN
jgi:hypothetical protein